jgi:DNA-binding protein H-NS
MLDGRTKDMTELMEFSHAGEVYWFSPELGHTTSPVLVAMAKKRKGAAQRLGSMSLEALVDLRDRVSARISKVAAAMRSELEGKLARIDGDHPAARPGRKKKHALAGRKVAAKYRDPKTRTTWAGRGAQPVWLREAIKGGAKLDDFLIEKGAGKGRKRRRRRVEYSARNSMFEISR